MIAEVLAKRPKLTEAELAKLVKELELNPQQSPFSNKTEWTLRKVYEEDHTLLEENFPLSKGDCGSGESKIRRWILENDWFDAIVMLPDQLFYNTGIFT